MGIHLENGEASLLNSNDNPGDSDKAGIQNAYSKSYSRLKLEKWLNKNMKIEMTDGRILIGIFLCTDRDRNIILGSCAEYLRNEGETSEEPRLLGLAMVPGHHIVSIHVDSDAVPSPPKAEML